MKRLIICALIICAGVLGGAAQTNLMGSWEGTLRISPAAQLRLRLNLTGNADAPTATLDSPDQSAFGIPARVLYAVGDSISVEVAQLKLIYSGCLRGNAIEGKFTQGSLSLPLQLARMESAPADAPKRPQTPVPPFPYAAEEVAIVNPDGGHTLCGTLTVPDKPAPGAPLAVLISGSGLQNRDEELFGHKPFAVLADALARMGIASFRYDDRGVAPSGGDASKATTADFASDARAVAQKLRAMKRFGRVGTIGHSEGGQIVYILGNEGAVDFAVSIAGPAMRGDSLLALQNKAIMAGSGVPASLADDYAAGLLRLYAALAEGKSAAEAASVAAAPWGTDLLHASLRENMRKVGESYAAQPWLRWFATHSPAADLMAIKVPLLAIFGTKDVQVPADENAAALRALAPGAQVRVFADLNHLMQHATTGLPAEYGVIEETISPEVLEAICTFILALPAR